MDRNQLGRRALLTAASAALSGSAHAQGQDFPQRPVRLVVPSPAGGPTDAIARLVAPALAEGWVHPAVVDNRVGGTGVVGSQAVARAAPDGHTLLVNASMHAIIPSVMPNLPFRVVEDFTAVALLATGPYVLVAHPSFRACTLPELIALAKSRPGQIDYASPGNGTGNHLASELFKARAGIDLVHVPYAGAAPATTDVVGGTVPLMLNNMISAIPHIEAGRLRALAVTGPGRSPALPDTPTFAETLPGFEAITWYGMFGPAGLPPPLLAELNRRANAAGQGEAVKARLAALGVEPVAETPEAFRRFVEAEVLKWAEVARLSNARLD
ncbi:tripartite tricarboxylate transporter substrate binding protein [Sabulicella glaciei]|uniref:Tripartite tricarboxylate transporter substrate binding protein n=1 Tax=Sabulicella glaciei TaxID=2984948 RepID=A0ABT3NTG1_9PROT|nr:tripartite tricarboxylate transporter substrate binding protein [Roseococcus sp. MDT2-1-1]MCW8085451.1 tripartite tricarboxylate transporter substrate binding protein [Roseococcus sp. MDT2-1-1]